jgi:uncharacterized protein (DUF433 family)
MMPPTVVIPRVGSFALASLGRIRKVHELPFGGSAGRTSFALKRIFEVVLVINESNWLIEINSHCKRRRYAAKPERCGAERALFTRKDEVRDQPSPVVVDPNIAFGRPVLAGRSVPTAVLADRFKAGDTLMQLAEDYDTSSQNIEEALRCELERKAA